MTERGLLRLYAPAQEEPVIEKLVPVNLVSHVPPPPLKVAVASYSGSFASSLSFSASSMYFRDTSGRLNLDRSRRPAIGSS